ncbi:MAG: hypothetical protein P8X90_33825 [Desulfobacterales bacterium]|jgi:hypothetical protein
MFKFIKRHVLILHSVFLILMLGIPFLLYYSAHAHATVDVIYLILLMALVMLFAAIF